MRHVFWVSVASALVVSALASPLSWTGTVDRAQMPGSTLAGPGSPVARGSVRPVSPPGVHVAPAVDEIRSDVDTTGLLQPLDDIDALLDQAEVDARQDDLLTGE
jgi:hypothetical protein